MSFAAHNEGNASDLRAPFPWFGGKRRAADLIWSLLGNPSVYVEPFAGSLAALLCRPIPDGIDRTGLVENVNDLDGHVVNVWRSIAWHPEETSRWADWPVTELDLHARHDWLIARKESIAERLRSDPEWCDPKAAGWWIWGACAWIGKWCQAPTKALPYMSGAGRGVHAINNRLDFGPLADRLRRVRVTCGDWSRICKPSVTEVTIDHFARSADPCVGVLLDPPYDGHEDVYGSESGVAHDVAEWCAEHGEDPKWRIVLCGYGEMPSALRAQGWGEHAWKAHGGYSRAADKQVRERVWSSPSCASVVAQPRLL